MGRRGTALLLLVALALAGVPAPAQAQAVVCPGTTVRTDADALALASCSEFNGTLVLTEALTPAGVAVLSFTKAENLAARALAQLTSLAGLRVADVAGTLTVEANPVLVSLDGLQALARVGGSVYVRENPKLIDTMPLTRTLAAVGGDVEVVGNPLLCNPGVGTDTVDIAGTVTVDLSCVPLTITMAVLAGVVAATLTACAVVEWRRRRVPSYATIN
jgi:hypothetical protein